MISVGFLSSSDRLEGCRCLQKAAKWKAARARENWGVSAWRGTEGSEKQSEG